MFVTLAADASPTTTAREVARLLGAHRGEAARVRRDVAALIDAGVLLLDTTGLQLVSVEVDEPVSLPSLSTGGSAERMRRLRERRRLGALGDALAVTGDAGSDGRAASPVTDSLSLEQSNFNSKRESDVTRVTRGPSLRRCIPPDLAFSNAARAKAEELGVREPALVWRAFVAHYTETKKLSDDWDDVWEKWVVREARWDRARPQTQSTKPSIDLNAPWLRAAGERT
ncbi:MAG TPA: hypothetical protein VF407_16090 [Polyangiaceae bacterium]